MGVIAEFESDPGQFVLGDLLLESAVERVELERMLPEERSVMQFLWVWGTEHEPFERRAAERPAISTIAAVDTYGDARLYRANWAEGVPELARAIHRSDARMLTGYGDGEGWNFELLFGDRDGLSMFTSLCEEADLPFTLGRLDSEPPRPRETDYGLTPKQFDILVTAAEQGYFHEPREATLADVADELGITAPSASGRLRRATRYLVEATVLDGEHRP